MSLRTVHSGYLCLLLSFYALCVSRGLNSVFARADKLRRTQQELQYPHRFKHHRCYYRDDYAVKGLQVEHRILPITGGGPLLLPYNFIYGVQSSSKRTLASLSSAQLLTLSIDTRRRRKSNQLSLRQTDAEDSLTSYRPPNATTRNRPY